MKQSPEIRPGRNDPCPCGSGKKYKSCCAGVVRPSGAESHASLVGRQQLAQQAAASGDFPTAEHLFRLLSEVRPNDAGFKAGLGQALCWLGRKREGLCHLTQAARLLERQLLKTRDPRMALELSDQLLYWGDAQAAEKLARAAVRVAPQSPQVLNSLVMCLTRVNRDDEALPLARKVCAALPHEPGCQILLALIESRTGEHEQALERLRSVAEMNRDPDQTARAWLEQGVILDKLGRSEEAFELLGRAGAAHERLARLRGADGGHLFRVLERNGRGFSPELLGQWPLNELVADGLPQPNFLMGFLRSGTTLTEQVLASHPHVLVTDECDIVHEVVSKMEELTGIIDDNPTAVRRLNIGQIRRLRRYYWQRLREEYGDEIMVKSVVDKNAMNTMDLGVISVLFPEARILFALRDPRDVCLSCFMQAFSLGPATVNLLSWEGIARQYAAVMAYWLRIRRSMQPRYLELRYEDTVDAFEETYRRVFDFLALPWCPEVERFHERARGRYISTPSFASVSKPLYRSALGRWKSYSWAFESIDPLLAPYLEAFGYTDQA